MAGTNNKSTDASGRETHAGKRGAGLGAGMLAGFVLLVATAVEAFGATTTYVTNGLQTVTFSLTTYFQTAPASGPAAVKTGTFVTSDFLKGLGYTNAQLLLKNGSAVARVKTRTNVTDYAISPANLAMGLAASNVVFNTTMARGTTNGIAYTLQGLALSTVLFQFSGQGFGTVTLPAGAVSAKLAGSLALATNANPAIFTGSLSVSPRRTERVPTASAL